MFGGVLMLMRYIGSLTSILPVAAIWVGLNVFFGVLGGTPGAAGEQVSWVAHIGRFDEAAVVFEFHHHFVVASIAAAHGFKNIDRVVDLATGKVSL